MWLGPDPHITHYVLQRLQATSLVVFFPGDLQDAEDIMTSYQEYSIEQTTDILGRRFPHATIVTVRPLKIHHVISDYTHFVQTDQAGDATYNCVQELRALKRLLCLVEKYNNLPIRLIGFSRGCIVLNEILLEIAYLIPTNDEDYPQPALSDLVDLIRRIRQYDWLDGGNGARSGAYITDSLVLSIFGDICRALDIKISIQGTPYQWSSKRRPWVAEEALSFHEALEKAGIDDIAMKLHFKTSNSLESHFKLLTAFD